MGGDHDGDAAVVGEPHDQVADLGHTGRVQAIGRLVQQEQLGAGDQGHRDAEALFHAQRVLARAFAGCVGESHDVEDGIDGALVAREVVGDDAEVLGSREVRVKCGALDERTDPGQDVRPVRAQIPAENAHLARGGFCQSQKHLHGGGFTGAVRTEETVDTPAGNGKIELVDDGLASVPFRDALGLDRELLGLCGRWHLRGGWRVSGRRGASGLGKHHDISFSFMADCLVSEVSDWIAFHFFDDGVGRPVLWTGIWASTTHLSPCWPAV